DNNVTVMRTLNKNNTSDKVVFFMRSTMYNNVEVEPLELNDFSIRWNGSMLDFDDKRLVAYLKFMARVYGNEYLQGFHDYRIEECEELVSQFNSTTYAIEGELVKAISGINKKEDDKTL
ncbi:MAG: hypothetical protein J6Q15_01085, partial [Clostridia bacterium]|nr:hypothetical protein [Clostridia bacterium]